MAQKKSLLIGMAIGAGAAIGIREGVRRLRQRGTFWGETGRRYDNAEHSRHSDAVLEPEDSHTHSHIHASDEGTSWIERGRSAAGAQPAMTESGSRTSTSTEAELRRSGTGENPVRYTRPTDSQAASGGEAPFIKEDK
ncbi:MAG TPA: hypothetical protein VD837_12355 [Terriglobales bacterium]|nr:hypothetical protein [Terriglobales bacterium]